MGKPRPTFWEAYLLGFAQIFRAVSIFVAAGATFILIVDLAYFAKTFNLRSLPSLIGGAAAMAAMYVVCGLFVWGSTTVIRALRRQVDQAGPW